MDFEALIADLGDLDTPQQRAKAALTVQQEITRAVARMWALWEVAGNATADANHVMTHEAPPEALEAFAYSLDEWWHECMAAEQAWSAAAGVPHQPHGEA